MRVSISVSQFHHFSPFNIFVYFIVVSYYCHFLYFPISPCERMTCLLPPAPFFSFTCFISLTKFCIDNFSLLIVLFYHFVVLAVYFGAADIARLPFTLTDRTFFHLSRHTLYEIVMLRMRKQNMRSEIEWTESKIVHNKNMMSEVNFCGPTTKNWRRLLIPNKRARSTFFSCLHSTMVCHLFSIWIFRQ